MRNVVLFLSAVLLGTAHAFVSPSVGAFGVKHRSSAVSPLQAVIVVESDAAFDEAMASVKGDELVIVDYSTTWCGPCKVISPIFDELSDKYTDAVFVKVIGDAT
eukprot:CAMPEP_0118701768 /NCGR_PEP_ID=MMETSP0800-20121206/17460_1 /TAXON_ID=210618 ORGANISM="Striatella unipunctata, Strain CCMP2910" /NCGR_SAMPLE_ID=MMETSP0800 /ASSEMBLY_ACC=CAM_ASM_000638 /LENGTH=103 /DNA_ID=CAMNT_0006602777 /DNA_START=141 /DNA_END=448 /DNA_ORIENTATION=+